MAKRIAVESSNKGAIFVFLDDVCAKMYLAYTVEVQTYMALFGNSYGQASVGSALLRKCP
jgi:hypothetical protein